MNNNIQKGHIIIQCPAGQDCLDTGRHYADNQSAITACLNHKANKERMQRNSEYIQGNNYTTKDNPERNAERLNRIVQDSKDCYDAADKINSLISDNNNQPITIETDFGQVSVKMASATIQERKNGKPIEHVVYEVDPEHSADYFHNGQTYCYYETYVGKQVTIDDTEDIKKARFAYITSDGKAGAYIKEDGEFGGLFSAKKYKKEVAGAIIDTVMEYNGDEVDHLECFDTYLTGIYAKKGFHPVAHIPFDEQYAPEGWNYEEMEKYHHGKPPIMIMVHKDHMKQSAPDAYNYDNETSYDGDNISNIVKRAKGYIQ